MLYFSYPIFFTEEGRDFLRKIEKSRKYDNNKTKKPHLERRFADKKLIGENSKGPEINLFVMRLPFDHFYKKKKKFLIYHVGMWWLSWLRQQGDIRMPT
jgi:hypothetical protein